MIIPGVKPSTEAHVLIWPLAVWSFWGLFSFLRTLYEWIVPITGQSAWNYIGPVVGAIGILWIGGSLFILYRTIARAKSSVDAEASGSDLDRGAGGTL